MKQTIEKAYIDTIMLLQFLNTLVNNIFIIMTVKNYSNNKALRIKSGSIYIIVVSLGEKR